MKSNASRLALAGLAALIGSCTGPSYVLVIVEATPGMPPISQLQSTATGDGAPSQVVFPASPVAAGITFPSSYAIAVPASTGSITVVVVGLDDGKTVARGSATATTRTSAQTVLTVTLTAPCDSPRDCNPDRVCAGTEQCSPQGACVQLLGAPLADGTACGTLRGTCLARKCRLAFCGDSARDADEECDDGAANSDSTADACRSDCRRAHCGDAVVDRSERCDLGEALNGTALSCNATCSLLGQVTTLAGTPGGAGYIDGVGAQARFLSPDAVAADAQYVYVAETDQSVIRRVSRSTGGVELFAGQLGAAGHVDGARLAATVGNPAGLALNGGTLYFTDDRYVLVRAIDLASGMVRTVAGTPGRALTIDGPAMQASFAGLTGIATCDGHELFVAEHWGCTIRRIDLDTQRVETVVGDGAAVNTCSHADGAGSAARLFFPRSLACDGTWLYVADDNGVLRIVDIASGYQVTSTVIGAGQVSLRLTVASGKVYVANEPACVIYAGPTGQAQPMVTALLGNGPGFANGVGRQALFLRPLGLVADPATHELFVADRGNSVIRQVDLTSLQASTLAGSPPTAGVSDGVGVAAQFDHPWGVTVSSGALYVADRAAALLRVVDLASASVSTAAGQPYVASTIDGVGAGAAFALPTAVVAYGNGLVIAESRKLRSVTLPGASVSTLAGGLGVITNFADGALGTATFFAPSGLATDGDRIWVADTGNSVIRTIDLDAGVVTTLAGVPKQSGTADGRGARFTSPGGVVFLQGRLYVADTGNDMIRAVDPATGVVTLVAGFPGLVDFRDGPGASAAFNSPQGLCTDGVALYVVDSGNNAIRQIDPQTRTVTTVAGSRFPASIDGLGSKGSFNGPVSCAFDATSGDLLVSDNAENVIRRIH